MQNIQNLQNLQNISGSKWVLTNSFNLPLKSSLNLSRWTWPATFTRWSIATLQDHEGLLKTAKSGEIRFEGARRVENLATGLLTQSITVISGNTYQVTIKGTNGATAICSGAFTGTLTADGVNRISWNNGTPKTTTTTTLTITITGILTELLVENVTGQSNQNPSEYVSNGILSAPYHGAGADGVKYFTTLNGNTVDINGVVTEATGTAIPEATLKGFLSEPQATNLLPYNTTMPVGQGWDTGSATVTLNAGISPDGGNNAIKFDDTGASGVPAIAARVFTATSTTHTVTIYTKTGTALTRTFALRNSTTSTNLHVCSLTYSTGILSGITGNCTVKTLPNGWYEITLIATSGITAGDSMTIYYGRLGVAGVGETDTWYLWNINATDLSYDTSPIATTTSTVTRSPDVLAYPTTNNLRADKWTIYLEYTPKHTPITENIYLFWSYIDASNYTAIFHDWTNLIFRKRIAWTNYDTTITNAFVIWDLYKIAVKWWIDWIDIFLNWVKGTNNSNTTNLQLGTTLEIWTLNSTWQPTANIKNIKFYKTSLSDSRLLQITNLLFFFSGW